MPPGLQKVQSTIALSGPVEIAPPPMNLFAVRWNEHDGATACVRLEP
jgi:hypothetical protein